MRRDFLSSLFLLVRSPNNQWSCSEPNNRNGPQLFSALRCCVLDNEGKCFTVTGLESRELLLLVELEQYNWFSPFCKVISGVLNAGFEVREDPPLACFVTRI